jgi:splicing factor 3B subunit 1
VAGEDFDPFAEHRRPTIADREDEYRAKRRKLIISPERVDPFAEGKFNICYSFLVYLLVVMQ